MLGDVRDGAKYQYRLRNTSRSVSGRDSRKLLKATASSLRSMAFSRLS